MDTAPTKSELYEVHVAGLPLKLKSSHDEQTVQELITLIDKKVNEAMASNASISFQKALLLAALHVAEDLVFLKRAVRDRLDLLENKAKGILTELDTTPAAEI